MANVKVILNEKVEKLGEIGEVVSVKPGYARNFLIPEGLASIPSLGEIKRIQKKKELLEKEYQREKTKADEIAKKINDAGDIIITEKAGEAGKLFGAVTAKDIADEINKRLSVEIVRKQVLLKKAISDLGEHVIKLKLHNEVACEFKLVIVKKEE